MGDRGGWAPLTLWPFVSLKPQLPVLPGPAPPCRDPQREGTHSGKGTSSQQTAGTVLKLDPEMRQENDNSYHVLREPTCPGHPHPHSAAPRPGTYSEPTAVLSPTDHPVQHQGTNRLGKTCRSH